MLFKKMVSIPFKRESVSKAQGKDRRWRKPPLRVSIPFKRESVSKEAREKAESLLAKVSIPFKRESVSKAEIN